MSKAYMRIRDLIRLSGAPRTTIHYYIREGLLHPPIKTGRTMGYYDETHLRRLQYINKLKVDMGLPMAVIRERLEELDRTGKWESVFDQDGADDDEIKVQGGRRQDIIDAAIRIFSEKGYYKTKVQDITSLIGISTGTFYIYFKNKRDLFVEVVDDVFRTIVGEAALALKNEDDPLRRLEIRGEVFYKNYSKYNEILHQLRAEMAGDDSWPANRVKKAYKDLTKPVIREVRDAIEKGICRPVDPELLAYTLTGIIEIVSMRLKLDDKYTFSEVQEFITDLIQNGIGPPLAK